jgi:folate-binding protein YgfZ
MTATTDFTGFIDINDHGFILLKGPDAKKFLQGQVTSDVDALTINEGISISTLGSHCTHKGRMLFSYRICAISQDTLLLSVYKPLIESAISALKKYSIFSKVDITDVSMNYRNIGYIGTDSSTLSTIVNSPLTNLNIDEAAHSDNGVVIKISDNRYECWLESKVAEQLPEDSNPLADAAVWTAFNIIDGIGEVRSETVEEFIPQMLNFQQIGQAISFNKGCYTGQEVVARMEYLGKLKRQTHRFSCKNQNLLPPGTPLYSPDKSQSIGNVVISALIDNQQQLLAVVTQESVDNDQVYIDEDHQQKLQLLPLPYAITKE